MSRRALALSHSRLEELSNTLNITNYRSGAPKTLCARVSISSQCSNPVAHANTSAPTMIRYTANGANPCFLTHAKNHATAP